MPRLESLALLAKPFYLNDDPAHDWAHILRVVENCRLLAQPHSLQLEALLAAAYCHDLVNLPKDHPDRARASELTGEKASDLLRQCHFVEEEIKAIRQWILEHSFSRGLKPNSLEGGILQDADRLDALGAIGVLRCASVNTRMRTSYYHPTDPLAQERQLNDREFMLDHYFIKLFKLPDLMNTPEGKVEAQRRVAFMEQFLAELKLEIKPPR